MQIVGVLLLILFTAACGSGGGAADTGASLPDGGAVTDAGGDAGRDDAGFREDFPVELLLDDCVEFKLGYLTSAANPFDLGEVEVTAEVVRPSGAIDELHGFWYQDYALSQDQQTGAEVLVKSGDPHFRARYLPVVAESGTYRFRVIVSEGGETYQYGYDQFEFPPAGAAASRTLRARPYVGVNPQNPLYFGFSDGTPFFPVGFDIAWHGSKFYFDYVHYIDRLAGAGGDWFRMWMTIWSNAIEWTAGKGFGDYQGLGRYAQDNAYRIDQVLRYADANDVKVLLTFGSYNEHTIGGYWNEGVWPDNPYNAANGGPCGEAADLFDNATAKRWYKNRLAYIAARWGYSPAIFAWEFWNEVVAPSDWVREMGRYIRAADGGRHMVSTTYGDQSVFSLGEIDFTQHHLYGQPDKLIENYPETVASTAAGFVQNYGKPFLLSEFGIDFSKSDAEWDPDGEGVNFHNGVWSAVAGGAAGTAMLWWWDSYIDVFDLYHVIEPVSAALKAAFPASVEGVAAIDFGSGASPDNTLRYGIGNTGTKLVWVVSKDSTWRNAYDNIPPAAVPAGTLDVPGFSPGCTVNAGLFGAWDGAPLGTQAVTADGVGVVTISTPEFARDIYVILRC